MFVYHRSMIPTEVLTDEQARLISEVSGRLPTEDSIAFDQLAEIITTELTSLGMAGHARTH